MKDFGSRRTLRQILQGPPGRYGLPEDYEYSDEFLLPEGVDEDGYDDYLDPLSDDVVIVKEKVTIF
ncbi:hypothetical protein Aduo_008694 [Ancylostoma duodenale]